MPPSSSAASHPPPQHQQRRMDDFFATATPGGHIRRQSNIYKRPRISLNVADYFRSPGSNVTNNAGGSSSSNSGEAELKRAIAASLAVTPIASAATPRATSEPVSVSGASSTASDDSHIDGDDEESSISKDDTASPLEESSSAAAAAPPPLPVKTVWERPLGSRGVVLKTTRPYHNETPTKEKDNAETESETGVRTRVRTGSLKRKQYSPNKAPEVRRSSVMPDGRVVALVNSTGKLYSFKEFEQMWDDVFEDFGCDVEEIEEGNMVTRGNNSVQASDTQGQSKAQYGRLLPKATDDLLLELKVCRHDVFVDIGHGIGNTVLQAAYTRGCESHGIEVMSGRNEVARLIQDNLASQRQIHKDRDDRITQVGDVYLKRGRLEVDEHRDFLVNPGRVTKAFLDNFNGVFAHRSLKARQLYTLDQFNAGLFCLMEPGSILITLWPLDLGPSNAEANALRRKHGFNKKHQNSDKASFYSMEKFSFGEAREVVTWSQGGGCTQEMIGYKYTRLEQSGCTEGAVFQCCNATCPVAAAGTYIPAFKYIDSPDSDNTDDDKAVAQRVILNSCSCKYTPATKRTRRPKQPYTYEG